MSTLYWWKISHVKPLLAESFPLSPRLLILSYILQDQQHCKNYLWLAANLERILRFYYFIGHQPLVSFSIVSNQVTRSGATISQISLDLIRFDQIRLHYSTRPNTAQLYTAHLYTALLDSKTDLVSIIFILELSVLHKSCLELNFQANGIICRVPCTPVFLRSRTSGFQY